MRIKKIVLLLFSSLGFISCVWESNDNSQNFLPLDDSEYPYAGIPRLAIETEDFLEIRNKKDEIPAKLQIYGESSPLSNILYLTVRGRGNSSLTMSKYGMKLEFDDKQSLFGMPPDRDWALIANHADKTLLKNYISFKIAQWLNLDYTPHGVFVELYFNRDYKGLYLLTETIKVSKNRVDLSKSTENYLIEVDKKYDPDNQIVFSQSGLPFRIRYPKTIDSTGLTRVQSFLNQWESYMSGDIDYDTLDQKWIDVATYSKYYWVEEFAKNIDNNFNTSVYFSWKPGESMHFGPVWDFDLSYGGYKVLEAEGWYLRWNKWNKHLFKNQKFTKKIKDYWIKNRNVFIAAQDSLKIYQQEIHKAAENNFKRWPILGSTFLWEFSQGYKSHDEAVDSLRNWMQQRTIWIDKHL